MSKEEGKSPTSNNEYSLCEQSVEELHERGILHGDLHAGNLLITKSGCTLLDYGLSNLVSEYLPNSEFLEEHIERASGKRRRRTSSRR